MVTVGGRGRRAFKRGSTRVGLGKVSKGWAMSVNDLFLTRVNFSDLTLGRGSSSNLSDMANVHRLVMSLFGKLDATSPRQSGGILFRVEQVRRESRILIQSRIKPKTDRKVTTIDASIVLDALTVGQLVRLELLANPVRRDSKTGADKPISADEVESWFKAKLAGAVNLTNVINLELGTLRCGRQTIATGLLDASAEVVDRDRLRSLVTEGVGRRKSHGCGLLSIMPERW